MCVGADLGNLRRGSGELMWNEVMTTLMMGQFLALRYYFWHLGIASGWFG